MASRIQVRRGTEADWTSVASSVVLAAGEPAVATGNSKGPLLYFGDGTSTFSALKAQVASFTPQSGSNTRYGHVTATDEDYTFTMLAAGDNARALGIASGGSLTFKSGSSMTVDDTATVNFDNVPDFNKGMIAYVGEDDNSDNVTEGGTVLVKRGATEVFKVDDYGNIAVTPVDDSGTVDPNLMLKMSDNADVGLQVRDPNNTVIFACHDNYVNSVQEIILGPVPDHAIPFTFAKIRSGTTPDNTDSGALANSPYLGTPHLFLQVEGDSTDNVRGKIVCVGNRNAGSGQTAFQISKNGDSQSRFAADYYGNVTALGTGTFADAKVNVTGRNLQDDSLVRKDELLATVMAQLTAVDSVVSVGNSDSDFPVGAIRVWNERDHTGNTFPVQFSRMGQDGESNISLVNAPTGKYLVAGWGANLISARFRVDSCRCAVVDHTTGVNETAVTLGAAAHSSFGFVIRLT